MNQKRAKAIRRLASNIAHTKKLEDRAYKEMGIGFNGKQVTITVAADTKRGQYIAIKNMVKKAYA